MDTITLAQAARFLNDEAAAQDALQAIRWPNGVACPLREGGKKVYEVAYTATARGKPPMTIQ